MGSGIESLFQVRGRYFRPVASHPDGALVHHGDCDIHQCLTMYNYSPCDCGLLYHLQRIGTGYREKIYPHYWPERRRHDVGRYMRDQCETPVEDIFPGAKIFEVPDNSEEEWTDIEKVFGTNYTHELKTYKLDSKCYRCDSEWSSKIQKGCPYCHDAFATWKVVSGGQTGADVAGLMVAKQFGLETGGWMPHGFKTTAGPRPEYASLYGIKEDVSPDYVPRTIRNVADSTGTIRLAANFNSPGEKCTLRAINDLKKPHLDVDLTDPRPIEEVIKWLTDKKIYILNVAGNATTTYPEAEREVIIYLTSVFDRIFSGT